MESFDWMEKENNWVRTDDTTSYCSYHFKCPETDADFIIHISKSRHWNTKFILQSESLFEKFPDWFQQTYKKAKSQADKRYMLRKELC